MLESVCMLVAFVQLLEFDPNYIVAPMLVASVASSLRYSIKVIDLLLVELVPSLEYSN